MSLPVQVWPVQRRCGDLYPQGVTKGVGIQSLRARWLLMGLLGTLVRARARPPQQADFGSQSHTPSDRYPRFGRPVTLTPAGLAPILLARRRGKA